MKRPAVFTRALGYSSKTGEVKRFLFHWTAMRWFRKQ